VLPVNQNLSSSSYSNWRYTINPAVYPASIKEGNNKITAKMLCEGNPVSAKKFYSVNVTGVNGTLPELVTANSNASAAPSVLPVSSNASVANQSSSSDPTPTNPSPSSDTTSSNVHHHESSGHQKNSNDKGTGNSSHHKKQSITTNHQGKGSDFAHNIITSIERRLGI
ncbi:MAG TPA: hypothetical protein VJR67_00665, partial [Candidatus Nitrosopolaris sp.]|nr:hypothetical protein [Candidatus Nitrosopolaris sp.]